MEGGFNQFGILQIKISTWFNDSKISYSEYDIKWDILFVNIRFRILKEIWLRFIVLGKSLGRFIM